MNKNKCSRDYLLIVKTPIFAKDTSPTDIRKHLIEQGEIIQFRYHHSAHFRTMVDNKYYIIDEETFNSSTEIVGIIWGKVQFANKATLKDIYNLSLFDFYGEYNCNANLYEKYSNFKKVNGLENE